MQGKMRLIWAESGAFSSSQNNTKFANFFILQQFATKLAILLKILLLAVVMDFVFLA
jgi:hypothetical protein